MSARGVWVVGAGKRVVKTALPALRSLPSAYEVRGVLARSERDLDAAGRTHRVRPLAGLRAQELAEGDLVYVAVGKDAVPAVLAALARLDAARLELLIDTPVLKLKHLRHAPLLRAFRAASVAEDTAWLPWYDALRAAVAGGAVGELERVVFERSAYAYHAMAMAKAVCGTDRVLRARRVRLAGGLSRRELVLGRGLRADVVEPRDYATGRVVVVGSRGRISDRPEPDEAGLALETLVEAGDCAGFRVGEHVSRLSAEEVLLARGDAPAATAIARMDAMKRVGFRRMLARVAEGRGAYPLEQALDDTAVDWFLERFGRWSPTPLTDVRSGLARRAFALLGRLGG